jgi:NADH-quinone oxidoreductase subunit F
MLYSAIPSYRLPRDIVAQEIESLLNDNIEIKCSTAFGKDFTLKQLQQNYQVVLFAFGAHKSKPLKLENEDVDGVIPSIQFLKANNIKGEPLARGHVGVIGGGNSAIDAARTAIRQKGVDSVTILYRRTEEEMPAYGEEIEAAKEEGVKIITLVSPAKIINENGKLSGLECIKNELGDIDSSGRRRPVPIEGSNYSVDLDTLIVAISEDTGIDKDISNGKETVALTRWATINVNPDTLETNLPGVFAAGDVTRGPDTVIDAIADGKKSAVMIDRYLKGEKMKQAAEPVLPRIYLEPSETSQKIEAPPKRAVCKHMPPAERIGNFKEVEHVLSTNEATGEARRCLRCDLEFTQPSLEESEQLSAEVKVK